MRRGDRERSQEFPWQGSRLLAAGQRIPSWDAKPRSPFWLCDVETSDRATTHVYPAVEADRRLQGQTEYM